MPKLSVIVPAYNSASTIRECLESIRNSEFKDFELILVDDGSTDATRKIAGDLADKLDVSQANRGLARARERGLQIATGDIAVFIDSDIVIRAGTLGLLYEYLASHPEDDAVTGMLSKENPYHDFFSKYKNLYMHYVFQGLPREVSFLYGAIFALRRECFSLLNFGMGFNGEDLCLGQQLIAAGRRIGFDRRIEVVHLRHYPVAGFIMNEFQIPYSWAKIMLSTHSWNQLFHKTGYAHASKTQLLSILVSPFLGALALFSFFFPLARVWLIPVIFVWVILNAGFLRFMLREQGVVFCLYCAGATYLDNVIKLLAVSSGFIGFIFSKR